MSLDHISAGDPVASMQMGSLNRGKAHRFSLRLSTGGATRIGNGGKRISGDDESRDTRGLSLLSYIARFSGQVFRQELQLAICGICSTNFKTGDKSYPFVRDMWRGIWQITFNTMGIQQAKLLISYHQCS